MYIITDHSGVVIATSETISYQRNGNVVINNGELAIARYCVGAVSEVRDVPANFRVYRTTYINGEWGERETEEEYALRILLEKGKITQEQYDSMLTTNT